MKWYGHLLRMKDSHWLKNIYQWTTYYRRRRGRPQQSWSDGFHENRNIEEDMAQDRHLWHLGMDKQLLAV